MKFHQGYYIHERFMDVAIEVKKVAYQDANKAKLKVIWWNRGWCGTPVNLYPHRRSISLTVRDFRGWKRVDWNDLIRYAEDSKEV